jgi:hypothetical protein
VVAMGRHGSMNPAGRERGRNMGSKYALGRPRQCGYADSSPDRSFATARESGGPPQLPSNGLRGFLWRDDQGRPPTTA